MSLELSGKTLIGPQAGSPSTADLNGQGHWKTLFPY